MGGDSQIGSYLVNFFERNSVKVFRSTRRKELDRNEIYLDLSKNNLVFPTQLYSSAIICAGVTKISCCEDFPEQSSKVNVDNTIVVIQRLLERGIRVVFLSSNSVFDGSKQFYNFFDEVSPISNYGRFKVAVENFFSHPNFSILRLTKVVTRNSPLIVEWEKYRKNSEESSLIVFKNHFISPISLNDVSYAVHSILMSKVNGIFHLGSNFELSYYDFAIKYFSSNKKILDSISGEFDPKVSGNKYNSLRRYLPE